MTKKLLLTLSASLVSLLALSACDAPEGQAWEAIEYEGVPYTEERTAGRGVKWVLAALAPEKGPVLVPIMKTTKMIAPQISMPVPEEPEIKNATPIFNDKMGKSK